MNREAAMRFFPVTAALDTDRNGELSPEEIANASASLMKLDANGDGKLTPDELLPKGPPPRGPGGGQGGPGGRGKGRGAGQGQPGSRGQGGKGGNGGQGQNGGERPQRPE